MDGWMIQASVLRRSGPGAMTTSDLNWSCGYRAQELIMGELGVMLTFDKISI